MTAVNKFYGRKFQLEVTLPSGDVLNLPANASQPEALRIVFNVSTVFYQVYWWADIDIYNLDQFTSTKLVQGAGTTQPYIKQGMIAKLSAGYENGNFGVIWQGPVFQAKFTRENVTDFKISLHCLLWLDPLSRTSVNSSYSAAQAQTDLIQKMVNQAFGGAVPFNASSNLQPVKQSRGGVVFGTVKTVMNEFADQNNVQWFAGPNSVTMARVDDNIATDTTARVFSPPASPGQQPPQADGIIVGTPEQTQYGVRFRVLLDPTVVVKYPAQLVNIDNSQIVMLKRSIGEYLNVLDQNNTYIVMGVRYYGDTRGPSSPWYTEIDGLTSVNGKWAAAQYLASKASLNN